MNKTVRVEARIEPELKEAAEAVFRKIGLSPEEAIRLFYEQVECHQCLPFAARTPNKETLAAMKEAENPEKLPSYENVDDLFADLGL
jgi:DNA-damage-inducible protein J